MSASEWTPPPMGAPVWIEIPATGSVANLKKFYEGVFPTWEWRAGENVENDDSGHQVAHITFGSKDHGGGIVKQSKEYKQQDQPMGSGMTVYYLVDDLQKTQAKVQELGGSTISGAEDDSNSGMHMNFKDPQGNRFGAYMLKPKE